jgi:hypothetical protein
VQTPSIGRIVHYRLSAADAEAVNRRRTTRDSIVSRIADGKWPLGAQAHSGNSVHEGQVLPLVITQVWPEEYTGSARLAHHLEGTNYDSAFGVNGQVLLDGNDSLWVTSAPEHASLNGCWCWPPRS